MANPDHLARLSEGVDAWNKWKQGNPNVHPDLASANLNGAELIGVELSGADLRDAKLSRANLRRADLSGADLTGADLYRADLSDAILREADLRDANLTSARMVGTTLPGAKLNQALIRFADLVQADLTGADLTGANLEEGMLGVAKLDGAKLAGADLARANLQGASLSGSDLNRANLSGAKLQGAKLSGANLCEADMRSAVLQSANLDNVTATGILLWQTQTAHWSIKGIICEHAFWDEAGEVPTKYKWGEFEKLHSDQTYIELFYQGGATTFELNTLPALLHHLVSLHPDSSIRLKSIEETGGGAKISFRVGDADPETMERIKADAENVQRAQLALREQEKEIERLKIVNEYLETSRQEHLIKAMFAAVKELPALQHPPAPQIVNYGSMTATAVASGHAHQTVHQTINDNAPLIALLKDIIANRDELALTEANAAQLESKLQAASSELQKQTPDHSIVRESLDFIKGTLQNFVGSLGAAAVTSTWQNILTQLTQLAAQFK